MRVHIKKDYDELSRWAANYVVYRINKHRPSPRRPFVLSSPSGSTPLGMYKYLAQAYKEKKVSFENVVFFGTGEYVGMGAGDEHGFQYFLWDKFLKFVNIKKEHVYFLNGLTTDLEKECHNYEKNIQKYGGINLFIGGVGIDGHIAFNEPYSSLVSRTRAKTLTPSTLKANSKFFDNDVSKVPPVVLTIGIATMMDAEEIMIMANGEQKAEAVKQAIEGPVTHVWPISVLQQHPHASIICDDSATTELSKETIEYFKGLEKNNPQFI
ncbi:MAG: glucosamine-6-phosphate deaminase [Alphaproteobacteria bacterium]|nr:glucosamine-6-phosphate deaminase [Alphaproteobacteria bacterium]